ncbi:hypothetical protein BBJ28_00025745, partial [Nothophytophthora sp. Chile5]
ADSTHGARRVKDAIQLAVDAAAEAGQSVILEWILNDDETKKSVRVKLAQVAAGGHFGVMQWLWCHYRTHLSAEGAIDEAARIGRLDIVQWLRERKLGTWDFYSLNKAAGNGHLDMVKWLHEHQAEAYPQQAVYELASETSSPWGELLLRTGINAMDAAASGGHLSVVQWLHENRTEGCSTAAMDRAAAQGHIEVVQWLHANRSEGCSKAAMNGAAKNGHLKVVQWLHAHRSEGCSKSAMNGAARGGHLKVVQWLHTNRTEGCNVDAMDGAAKYGHLEVVQWLHANRSEGCTTSAMDAAAGRGDLELVRWLHAARQQLDTGDLNKNAVFWKEVTVEFRSNTRDYNEICTDDPLFEKIRPSTIVPHSTAKLIDMWKDINRIYSKALARYTASGTHTSDFRAFAGTNIVDVMYLRFWLSQKPNLTSFVEGGLLDRDILDSSHNMEAVMERVDRLTDYIIRNEQPRQPHAVVSATTSSIDQLLDPIGKIHV